MANYSFMGVQLSNETATLYSYNTSASSAASYSTVTRLSYSDGAKIFNNSENFYSTANTFSTTALSVGATFTLVANSNYNSSAGTPATAASLMLGSQTTVTGYTPVAISSGSFQSSTSMLKWTSTGYTETTSSTLVSDASGVTRSNGDYFSQYTTNKYVPIGSMTGTFTQRVFSGTIATMTENQEKLLVSSSETGTLESSTSDYTNTNTTLVTSSTLSCLFNQLRTTVSDTANPVTSLNTTNYLISNSVYITNEFNETSTDGSTSESSSTTSSLREVARYYKYSEETLRSSTAVISIHSAGWELASASAYYSSVKHYSQDTATDYATETSFLITSVSASRTFEHQYSSSTVNLNGTPIATTTTLLYNSTSGMSYISTFNNIPVDNSLSEVATSTYSTLETATYAASMSFGSFSESSYTFNSMSGTADYTTTFKTTRKSYSTISAWPFSTASSSINDSVQTYSYQQDNTKFTNSTTFISSVYTATAAADSSIDTNTYSALGTVGTSSTSAFDSEVEPNRASVISTSLLSLAQTVSGSCYTYLTSYTGSLEYTSNFDTYSTDTWLNMAVVSTSTEVHNGTYNDNGYGILKQVSSTVSESTFGISQYDSTVQRQTSTATAATNFGFIGTTFDYFRGSSLVVRTVSVSSSSHNDVTQYFRSTTSTFSYTDINGALGYDNMYVDSYNNEVYFNYLQHEQYNTSSSSNYDTVNYGTSYRQSTAVGTTSEAHAVSDSIIQNYSWNYEVKSMWSYDTMLSTISTYSTQLRKQFTYSNASTSSSVGVISYTVSTADTTTSLTGRTAQTLQAATTQTWSTIQSKSYSYYNTVTAAPYSMITATSLNVNINYTTANTSLVTSTADLSYATTSITSGTYQTVNSGFNYSSSSIVATSYEQISSTMQFYSTVQYGTTYSATVTASSVTSSYVDISATANTTLYNGTTSTIYSSVNGTTYVSSTAEYSTKLNTFTSTVTYTPIYSSSNGIFITTH